MLALLLVALSLGLDNFAGAIGIGISGVDARLRMRIGLVFALFEAGMPALGLLLGHHLAHALGNGARPLGGGLLGLAGAYTIVTGLSVATERFRRRGGASYTWSSPARCSVSTTSSSASPSAPIT